MLIIHVLIALHQAYDIEAYTNNLFYLINNSGNVSGGCHGIIDVRPLIKQKLTAGKKSNTKTSTSSTVAALKTNTVIEELTFSTVTDLQPDDRDPLIGFQTTLNKILFGENLEMEEKFKINYDGDVIDSLAMYPSGSVMRAELFQNKSGVHLPRSEFMHRGHLYLNTSGMDYMQTAVNAFNIFLEGSLEDVQRLPAKYVLRSSRTIAMMKIAREKLVATWKVVKGNQRPRDIGYLTLEYYRPLFKYINGREMARLNLEDDRILSFLGTHSDLDRHQVGVIASDYIKRNPNWSSPKYLNLMNNLLCGVPMKFMRKIPENVYLQLSHQLFYHIKACDPLQRRFYLAMMTRTQVLGKSNSWGARDVARLGLLLTEVEGPDLSAINPEAMAGITPQVMIEMSPRNLMYLTETQIRYLAQKPLNILTKRINNFDDDQRILSSAMKTSVTFYFIFWFVLAIKILVY